MANNLAESGLSLRTMQFKDWGQFITDLNYQFTQIAQMPGFMGIMPKPDVVFGPSGDRGSGWIFVEVSKFTSAYPNILSGSQINEAMLSYQLKQNPTKLFTALGVVRLVDGDVIVLPNNKAVKFASSDQTFNYTGVDFSTVKSLTENDVRDIVTKMTNTASQTNPIFGMFDAIAKNFADGSAGMNSEMNNTSILDVPTFGAGVGVKAPNHRFIGAKESYVSSAIQTAYIFGSLQDYHKIAQDTLKNNTVDYMPGVDDFGAAYILQNSYKNGLLIGHKNSTSFRKFSRMYRDETSLHLTSSFSPNTNEFSEFGMSDVESWVRTNTFSVLSDIMSTTAKKFSGLGLNWDIDGNTKNVKLGYASSKTTLVGDTLWLSGFSRIGTYSDMLSVVNGEIVNSGYLFPTAENIEKQPSKTLFTYSKFNDYQEAIETAISEIEKNINSISDKIQKDILSSMDVLGPGADFDSVVEQGMYGLNQVTESTQYGHAPTYDINNYTNPTKGFLIVFESKAGDDKFLVQHVYNGISSDARTASTWSPTTGIVNGGTQFRNWSSYYRFGMRSLITGRVAWMNWSSSQFEERVVFGSGLTMLKPANAVPSLDHSFLRPQATLVPYNPAKENMQLIKDITFDRYGHPIGYNTYNVAVVTKDQLDSAVEGLNEYIRQSIETVQNEFNNHVNNHSVEWNSVNNKPTTFTPSKHRHDYSDLDNIPPSDVLYSATVFLNDVVNKLYKIKFDKPLPHYSYTIFGSIESWGTPINDSTILWSVESRATDSFVISIREIAGVVQKVWFNFIAFNKTGGGTLI